MPTPKFPKYKQKNTLRPNPHAADPSRGDLAYAQGSSTMGDFGDEGAAVRPALGLPKDMRVVAQGQPDPTVHGFIPSPGATPLLLGAQTRPPRAKK
jgi:hypothetical protein